MVSWDPVAAAARVQVKVVARMAAAWAPVAWAAVVAGTALVSWDLVAVAAVRRIAIQQYANCKKATEGPPPAKTTQQPLRYGCAS